MIIKRDVYRLVNHTICDYKAFVCYTRSNDFSPIY